MAQKPSHTIESRVPALSAECLNFAVGSFPATISEAETCFTGKIKHMLASLAKKTKHTTAGIRWWSPTQLLTGRRVA